MEMYWYPKCSTCQKAYKHLKQKNIDVVLFDIVEQTPSIDQLKQWIEWYGKGIKPFFNTAGKVYKEMGLKDRVNSLSIDEACELLSSNGMLIKRPLLIDNEQVIVGYKQELYETL